ncbi:type II toxin-antitoxin system VapC family toxin [Arthrobacter sp. I2-34]|uniref:Type II toxin-antitoxin system VapC family toxin n=1 Tax=Arthrobacter hankyongi TaxID=2904801 RepID=A0ABS9L382_9MICC|nr:type II toxin-antitoxin system VapC family toxin [Arthrobacter hankyongi]MCG2621099.1 type II toxin-antitoxin system VapC family toxin [Arthrobacter hankyongi]
MITYWDTSAFVPLLVLEPGSAACRRLWHATDVPLATRLLFVETAAALEQAHRIGRIGGGQLRILMAELESYWDSFGIVELDDKLMRASAKAAGRFALRGYDAVHCAAGLAVSRDPAAVLISGDSRLLAAWQASGAATADTAPR